LITFYIGSDSLIQFIFYLFTSQSNKFHVEPSLWSTGENYQPRSYSGKAQSINIDYRIQYKDFNYLKPETLTYQSQIYSNNIEILFRFPKKTTISALLLIFHACKHTASDWFHTVERQRIIGGAINLGYACLVFQATDRNNQCWSNDADIYENNDVQMVFK